MAYTETMDDSDNQNYIWGITTFSVLIIAIFVIFIHNDIKSNSSDIPITTENSSYPPPSDRDVNGCYTPKTVRKHYGETDCVVYSVGYTYETSAGTKFLDEKVNYKAGFVGYIPRGSAASSIDINALRGKKIKVTGKIQEYKGYPEIIITDSSQVGVYN